MQDALTTEVLVVGAGMTGLTAACELQRSGLEVLVVDKNRSVGGRVATRRTGRAAFDYGAQFITARSPRFAGAVDQWIRAGVAEEWYQRSANQSGGHSRWRGKPTMAAIPKHLVASVRVLLERRLASLRIDDAQSWAGEFSGGDTVRAGAVLLTPPVPKALALLDAGKVELSPQTRVCLEKIRYEPCFAVMAVLDGPSGLPLPGGLALRDGPLAWIADNQMKGVSAVPAVTIHATGMFSRGRWECDREETGKELLRAAEPWLGSNVIEWQIHGWRDSRAVSLEKVNCLTLSQFPPLVIAGDAFVAPRVEGAVLSGWAAADTLKQLIIGPGN